MDLWNFIKKYYIDSIVYKEGYNIVNTITWAILLLISVYLLYRFLEKRFEIDKKFVLSNIPFIVFGSGLRVVEDAVFISPPFSYVFMSPFIFFLIFLLAFPTLLLSKRFFGEKYYKFYATVGILASLCVYILLFSNLRLKNPVIPFGLSLAIVATLLYSFIFRSKDSLSLIVIFSHMFDGFETYFGVEFYGYREIHVLPSFLVEVFGGISLPFVKFLVIGTILYILDTSKEEEKLKNFVKFVLLVFGLAPALRNGLRITFNV